MVRSWNWPAHDRLSDGVVGHSGQHQRRDEHVGLIERFQKQDFSVVVRIVVVDREETLSRRWRRRRSRDWSPCGRFRLQYGDEQGDCVRRQRRLEPNVCECQIFSSPSGTYLLSMSLSFVRYLGVEQMLHFFRNLICVNLFLSLRILISFYFANVHCLYQSIHGRQLRFSFIICLPWNKLLAAVFFTSHDCPLFVQGKNFSLYIRRYDVLFHIDTKQALMNRIA